jgi:hypothetical protein
VDLVGRRWCPPRLGVEARAAALGQRVGPNLVGQPVVDRGGHLLAFW